MLWGGRTDLNARSGKRHPQQGALRRGKVSGRQEAVYEASDWPWARRAIPRGGGVACSPKVADCSQEQGCVPEGLGVASVRHGQAFAPPAAPRSGALPQEKLWNVVARVRRFGPNPRIAQRPRCTPSEFPYTDEHGCVAGRTSRGLSRFGGIRLKLNPAIELWSRTERVLANPGTFRSGSCLGKSARVHVSGGNVWIELRPSMSASSFPSVNQGQG